MQDWRKNKALLTEFRRPGYCEWCERYCPNGLDPHHVPKRGAGGGNRIDSRLTLISLCRGFYRGEWVSCHEEAERGTIRKEKLEAKIAAREGCRTSDLRSAVKALLTLTARPWESEIATAMEGLKMKAQLLIKKTLAESSYEAA